MLAKELGVVFALGCRTQTLVRHVVTQLLGHHQSGRVGSHGTGRISPPEGVGRGIVEQPPQLRILRLNQVRCEEPSSDTRAAMKLFDRVVVEGDRLQTAVSANLEVVLSGVPDEILEGAIGVLAKDLVVESHTESASRITKRPDFRILAVRPFRMRAILRLETLRNAMRMPFERLGGVAGDLEWPRPFVVAGNVLV